MDKCTYIAIVWRVYRLKSVLKAYFANLLRCTNIGIMRLAGFDLLPLELWLNISMHLHELLNPNKDFLRMKFDKHLRTTFYTGFSKRRWHPHSPTCTLCITLYKKDYILLKRHHKHCAGVLQMMMSVAQILERATLTFPACPMQLKHFQPICFLPPVLPSTQPYGESSF